MQRQRRAKRRGKPARQKVVKHRLLKITAAMVGIALLLALGLAVLVKTIITKEFLVAEIEKSINSEAVIGDVTISIYSFPAEVTLNDFKLSPKGAAPDTEAPVQVEEVRLSVSLWSLLGKHLNVSDITIRGADIKSTYHEDGSTSLEKLFESPDGEKRSASTGEKGGGFNAFEQEDFIATLGGLSIENSRATILLESMGVRMQCLDIDFQLSSIKIDPKRLAETNSAELQLSTHLRIDSVKGWQYGDIYLSGDSATRIFNPTTGDAEPEVEGDFQLSEESWLNTRIPLLTKSWNHLAILEKVGINVPKIPERATFGRSEALAAHYHLGKITVKKPLSVWLDDWELAALDDSWLDTKSDQHEIFGELLASKSSSVHFRSVIFKGVEILPEMAQEKVKMEVESKMFRDQRLLVALKSSEDFSDPKIRPVGAIVDYAEAVKDAAQKLLEDKARGILDGLFGGDDE